MRSLLYYLMQFQIFWMSMGNRRISMLMIQRTTYFYPTILE